MSLADTFTVMASLPDADHARLLKQALAEPHEAVQRAAVEAVLAARKPERLALLVGHFPDLLPAVREQLGKSRAQLLAVGEEAIRKLDPNLRAAAFQLIAEMGDLAKAPMILPGLEDRSVRIRSTTEAAVKRWMEDFYTHLLQAKKNRDRVSRELVQLFRGQALEVVQTMLQLYDQYPNPLYVKTGIELGEPAYLLFLDRVLERPGSPLYKAFITSMAMAHSPEAVELLMRLTAERAQRARTAAEEISARRHDPAFGHEVASYFARLDADALGTLAGRMVSAPWWDAALQSPDLNEHELRTLAQTLRATRLDPVEKRDRIRALLGHPVGRVRAVGYEELDRMDIDDMIEVARAGLEDADPEVILAAARILAQRGVTGLAGDMARHVRSPNLELSQLALRMISEESFKRYISAFDRLDEPTRQRAAQAISKIDTGLIDRLRSEIESLDSARRLKALKIIEYADKETELRPILMDLLYDPDVKVRSTAIKTIQLSGSAEGMRLLIDALNDPDRRIRANAVEAFEEIGDTRFIALLKPFLRDTDNRVRGNAAKALFRLNVLEARQTLVEMLGSDDRLMRLSAAWVMRELGAEEFRRVLSEQLQVEQDAQVAARIREALSETRMMRKPPEGT